MMDEIDVIAFALWTAETGNASRQDWEALSEGQKDKWVRMARAAMNRMNEIRLFCPPLNVYHADHHGVILDADSIIVANTEEQARGLLDAAIKEHGFSNHVSALRQLNTTEPKCFVINDGDY